MKLDELIKALEGMLPEKVPYGDLIGAEGVYAHSGPLAYEDPEPYFIEYAVEELKKYSKIQAILGDNYDLDQLREAIKKQSEYKEFMNRWKNAVSLAGVINKFGANKLAELVEANNIAVQPLTLEELQQMENVPVYIQDLYTEGRDGWYIITWDATKHGRYLVLTSKNCNGFLLDEYGESWLAYSYNPSSLNKKGNSNNE